MTRLFKLNFLILIVITSAFSSCGQTSPSQKKSEKKVTVKNYFDKQDQILFKLYKKTPGGVLYWETWNNDEKSAIVHWGLLGSYGEQRAVATESISTLKDSINSLIADKIKEGFSEIPNDKQFTLAITFKLKTWGTPEDLDRREKYRNFITEHLGWTGNERCDDGDIGSGEMTLYADVVDPQLAIKTMPKDLLRNGVKEDYYFTISQGDKTIAEKILPSAADKH
jgi:hypothetical protein